MVKTIFTLAWFCEKKALFLVFYINALINLLTVSKDNQWCIVTILCEIILD